MPSSQPVFAGVYLAVADMAASVDFYRRLGLDVPDGSEGEIHVRVPLGEGAALALGTLELTKAYNPGWQQAGAGATNALQFDVPTRGAVDEVYERMTAAGAVGLLAPFDAFWGTRYAEIADPDGNVVGVHSPRDPAKVSPPPL
jgi:catechol 2,3-dioxygenase-like lactoylglutathione lyase family enzyme